MIGALRGKIASISNQTIIVMAGGVGYQLTVPRAADLTVGEETFLHTYLAVRETALDLYGFATEQDKEMFTLLLSVPKIGPKSALDILTKAETNFLLECVSTEDPSRLQKLSGIGKKTCENIVSNLSDKIEHLIPASTSDKTETSTTLNTTQHDAIDALVSLGYDPKTAREKVLTLATENLSVSDLVARALK